MTKQEFMQGMRKIKRSYKWEESGPYTCNEIRNHIGIEAQDTYTRLFSATPDKDYDFINLCFCTDFREYINPPDEEILTRRITALTIFERIVLEDKLYVWWE